MTEHGIYSIYDRKAQYYLPLFSARSDTDAERMFTESVVSSDTPVSQYPADFDLIRLGTIDLEKGTLTSETPVVPIVNGLVALTAAQATRRRYQQILNPAEVADDVQAVYDNQGMPSS